MINVFKDSSVCRLLSFKYKNDDGFLDQFAKITKHQLLYMVFPKGMSIYLKRHFLEKGSVMDTLNRKWEVKSFTWLMISFF